MEIVTQSAEQTRTVGEEVGRRVMAFDNHVFLAMEGDLGSGKTTFIQGFASGVGVDESINSPTFVIFKKYLAKEGRVLYHFDAYRIGVEDLSVLGFNDIIKEKNSVVVVEWSENINGAIPKWAVKIKMSVICENSRRLIVEDNNDIIGDKLLKA